MRTVAVLVVAYVAGAIPFSNLFAHRLRGVDLRDVGSGTVSGTGLYRVAGFGALATAGVLDIAKGAVGPALAGHHHTLAALACGAAVVGHSWSVFVGGSGGRGISPAIGGLLVVAWPGAVILLVGLTAGRLVRHTGLGTFVADLSLPPALAATHGRTGALAGAAVVIPMLVKRVLGNEHPAPGSPPRVWVNRLLYDADEPALSG